MLSLNQHGKLLRFMQSTRAAEVCGLLVHQAQGQPVQLSSTRAFSNGSKKTPFRPRRRPNEKYRPVLIRPKLTDWSRQDDEEDERLVDLSRFEDIPDDFDERIAPVQAANLRGYRQLLLRRSKNVDLVEEEMRLMDYLTSQSGSTEDLMYERRFLNEAFDDDEEKEEFLRSVEDYVEEETDKDAMRDLDEFTDDTTKFDPDELFEEDDDVDEEEDLDQGFDEDGEEDMESSNFLDPLQRAYGEWAEFVVSTDRTIRLWRGGRLESYRALVVGGNGNGCAGFGIGKGADPNVAVQNAGILSKRNIFFVDRYQNNGLTRDLVGKQNSCVVTLRATDNGLRGNDLVCEILLRFGITNCVAKSHGNRNVYNVVRATFKALLTHESLENISLKRGKRIMGLDRARRILV